MACAIYTQATNAQQTISVPLAVLCEKSCIPAVFHFLKLNNVFSVEGPCTCPAVKASKSCLTHFVSLIDAQRINCCGCKNW